MNKEDKCIVLNCKNKKIEGKFVGDICNPCYEYLISGKVNNSQACKNDIHNLKIRNNEELINEELKKINSKQIEMDYEEKEIT